MLNEKSPRPPLEKGEKVSYSGNMWLKLMRMGITLSDANQLVRWYRYLSQDYHAIEVVREQISPIIATVFTEDSSLSYEIDFRRPLPRPELLTEEQLSQLSANLRLRGMPSTSELLLLDAQEALAQYRYRETVLLAWLVYSIAGSFQQLYNQ